MEDRISELPDSLICHILSFLPTKLAATTSVLSKRWTPLWRSVLTLDFDEQGFTNFDNFCHFVNSVLDSRHPTLLLLSLRINLGHPFDFYPRDVRRILHTVMGRRIQNFNLSLQPQPRQFDPTTSVFSVLNCRTLVVLKLTRLIICEVPLFVHFPLLKTLHLVDIYFMNIAYVDFRRLLYECPVLENLQTNRLHSPYLLRNSDYEEEDYYEVFPKLVTSKLSNSAQNFTLAWLHNAKFLSVELPWAYEYQIPTFHYLTHMELIFKTDFSFNSWPEKWKWIIQVLQHCPKLQNLTIDESSKYIPFPKDKNWEDPETVPECLSSQLRTCLLRGSIDIGHALQFAKFIILNSKLLRTMTIKSTCLDKQAKHQMQVILSSCPTVSATCTLLVD